MYELTTAKQLLEVLSRNPKAITNYSKIIQWIKSRNCDVIGDFIKIYKDL